MLRLNSYNIVDENLLKYFIVKCLLSYKPTEF